MSCCAKRSVFKFTCYNRISEFLLTAFQTHHKLCNEHLDIPHILFDYHQKVKSGNPKNLSELKQKVQKYVEKFGFFTKKGPDVTREQFGTVRTNCTDCLDRTNCVQLYLGLEVRKFQKFTHKLP